MCVLLADFYNWNRVKIRYCDGASFAGDAKFDNGVYALWTHFFILVLITRAKCLSSLNSYLGKEYYTSYPFVATLYVSFEHLYIQVEINLSFKKL